MVEFPAVSHTRLSQWGAPQYTRKGMLLFTVIFGAFGLHHLLLRSPQTMLLFWIGNLFSLGYWYFYDIAQLASSTTEELNQYGMSLPWGPAGIAQGMWKCGEQKESDNNPPSVWWFVLYTMMIPLGFLAPLSAGDTYGAFAKLITILSPLIILYPLYLIFDYYQLLVKPKDLFDNGVQRYMPFTTLGMDSYGPSQRITGKEPPPGCETPFLTILKTAFPSFFKTYETTVATAQTAVNTVQTVKTEVVDRAQRGIAIASEVGKLSGSVAQGIASGSAKAAAAVANPESLIPNPEIPIQKGGGLNSQDSWMLGGIAAVLGGGFLLTAGRSFFDAIQHYKGPSDTPPTRS